MSLIQPGQDNRFPGISASTWHLLPATWCLTRDYINSYFPLFYLRWAINILHQTCKLMFKC